MTVERAKIDQSMLAPCADPVTKPEQASDAQIGRLWNRDRTELRACKAEKAALAAAVTVVER